MDRASSGDGMRLADYVALVKRRWMTIVLFLVLGVASAVLYLKFAPQEYSATTAVLVTSTTAGVPDSLDRGSEINLDTEAQLVTSTEIVTAAAERLEGGATARELADRVRVSVPPNTEILEIAYLGGTPREAQAGSRAFAEAYLEERRVSAEESLTAEEAALQTRIDTVRNELKEVLDAAADLPEDSAARGRAENQATVLNNQLAALASQQGQVQAATVSPGRVVTQPGLPSTPSSPDPVVALATGVVLGLLVGLGIAALRQRSDDVLHSPDDVFRRTRVPVAGVLAGRLQPGAADVVQPLSSDGRGYARLRNLVTSGLAESNRRVVLVAGVRHGGGPVAVNLAASLARSGEDVHLVCADVFGNTAGSLFPGRSGPGLAEVLSGEMPVDAAVRRVEGLPNLTVLGPGRDPDRADALLQTRSPRTLVDELLRTSAYVVIEAPATVESADAQTLANVAEIAILVVEAGDTRGREVVDATAQLESMGTPVLGAVVARYERGHRPSGTGPSAAGDLPSGDSPDAHSPQVTQATEVREVTPQATEVHAVTDGSVPPESDVDARPAGATVVAAADREGTSRR